MKTMALIGTALLAGLLCAGVVWFLDVFVTPLFLNSRIERLGEQGLPKATVVKGGIIHCRMKADDFRFPLPPGSRVVPPIIISGGFDTVDGSVEIRFEGTNQLTADEYQKWVSRRLQVGGSIEAHSMPEGLSIAFHYFGDR